MLERRRKYFYKYNKLKNNVAEVVYIKKSKELH